MKKETKKYLFICLFIILISLLILLFINLSKRRYLYLILDNEIIKYEDGKYNKVDFEDAEDELFKVLVQKQYLGNYYADSFDYEAREILFKLDNESYVFSQPLLGLQSDIKLIDFNKVDFEKDDLNYLNEIYHGNDFKKLNDFTEASKVVIDLDNNGIKDTIYNVIYELDEDYAYSTIYIDLNGNIEVLCEEQGYDIDNRVENIIFYLQYIIDIDNDGNYELIISHSNNDIDEYSIYSLNGSYEESYYTSIGGE